MRQWVLPQRNENSPHCMSFPGTSRILRVVASVHPGPTLKLQDWLVGFHRAHLSLRDLKIERAVYE
jgi:hypothetical protein